MGLPNLATPKQLVTTGHRHGLFERLFADDLAPALALIRSLTAAPAQSREAEAHTVMD
jgi:hypothetical protein